LADAATNDPVCSQTMTGAADPAREALLAQMFIFRQSSFPVGLPVLIDGQFGGGVEPGTGVVQGVTGCGGLQRLFPTGAAA
jgi:hypothetical protein